MNSSTTDPQKTAKPGACALVVHVWHLDTLNDLAAASRNFPADADCFVTYADSFPEDARKLVATSLPGARYIPVVNAGQDVGALFQMMDVVDLGRYDFICKVHSKRGAKMPTLWRRTLLDGVLRSSEQVDHIIRAFQQDPKVMLAGARQLFLHGPAYLWGNADRITELCGSALQGFDFRHDDWGFIAGTCFWIRTDILLRLKALNIDFEPGAYTDDGTPAHTLERMFGMMATILGGTVLLDDRRSDNTLPQPFSSFPENLSRRRVNIVETLSTLEAERARRALRDPSTGPRRVAVFASHCRHDTLPPQVLPYLRALRHLTERLVVVFDNDLGDDESKQISAIADHVITGRHGEYDFGSYKRGVAWLRDSGFMEVADSLILCNDSCFGPIGDLGQMIHRMEARDLDIWAASDSQELAPHLQSFFLALNASAFQSAAFQNFIEGITVQPDVQQVIRKYELGFTRTMVEAGFTCGAMVENRYHLTHPGDPSFANLTLRPQLANRMGMPFVKVKSLTTASHNLEGIDRTLSWLQKKAPDVHATVVSQLEISRFRDAASVAFSVIMPTRNRAWCILDAVASVMQQTHQPFELLIIDDASTDGTEDLIRQNYAAEIASGKLRYFRLDQNVGVSNARNIGLTHAAHDWICYADSDNRLRDYHLAVMAGAVIEHPDRDCIYGRVLNKSSGTVIGRPFGERDLVKGNHIDLGAFTHRKSLVARFGNFDPALRRLVDWELIIRYTRHKEPAFVPLILLDYSDRVESASGDRISVSESYLKADIYLKSKHSHRPTVSTVIISYNHQAFIVEAIESALEQRGDFHHEILLSDDGSTDGTTQIIAQYAEKYPDRIRNISTEKNLGISANYRHSFREAGGNFVSILEGDDYWTDPDKTLRQAEFLAAHPEAEAVFSRIELLDMVRNRYRLLKRQDNLPALLTGAHFARNEHLNLIVNFSSMMIRRQTLLQMPSSSYEPRLSEITLAFYLDRLGKIGFIDKSMGVYRLNPSSVWTGADRAGKLKQAIATRKAALAVADPRYHHAICQRINEKQRELNDLQSTRIIAKGFVGSPRYSWGTAIKPGS